MSDLGEPTFSNEPLDVSELPSLETQHFRPVSDKSRTLDLLTTALAAAVFGVGVTVGVALTVGAPWVFAAAVAVLVLAILALWRASLAHRYRGWQLREHDLSYRSGVINRGTITIPFTRVQHAAVSDGPVERALGLARLMVFSAGGSTADLVIPGLDVSDAEQLKAHVLAAAGTSV